MKTTDAPIEIEHNFKVGKERLWEAITNPVQMRVWYFDNIPEFKPEVGFKTAFSVKSDDRVFPHVWQVTQVIPQEQITYSWTFEGYEGKSSTCFTIKQDKGNSILYLKAIVLKDFPDTIPEFKRESGVAGWQYLITQQLDTYLND
ncbi:SRPBCC family protein [Lacinutrix chionoecetis]